MKNEHKSEITEETVTEAKDAHPLLPSVIGLAVKTLLKKVTSAETERYNPELEVVFISYKNGIKKSNVILTPDFLVQNLRTLRPGFDLAIFARVLSKSFSNFSSSNFSSFAPWFSNFSSLVQNFFLPQKRD